MTLEIHPLTHGRFADLVALFSSKGCSFARQCWCMDYRISGKPDRPDGVSATSYKRDRLRALSGLRIAPGLLGYADELPVAWVSLGPRETFARLQNSPIMKPVDDRPVWSIVCFIVHGERRGQGLARDMLGHAVGYAREHGAEAIEGYPIDRPTRSAPQFLWHGAKAMFDDAGFQEIARRKQQRPIMRLEL